MDKREAWNKLVEEKSAHYLNLGDGGFDEKMHRSEERRVGKECL